MAASPMLRQTVLLTGLLFCSISNGFSIGQMSGMLGALYSRKDGIDLSDDEISWIASSFHITTICGFALAAFITEIIGRKRAFSIFSVPVIFNWILLFYAKKMNLFILSRILMGISFGGVLSMCNVSIGEYTSPNIRGLVFAMMDSVGPTIGGTLGHILGILYHWRTVALVGIIPAALGGILPLFSEESSSWLASKGKFEKCDKAFRRFRGTGAETELQILKEVEKCKKQRLKDSESIAFNFKKFILAWKKEYFWKILLLSSVINVYFAAAGKLLYVTLAITMLENITGRKDVLLFTLVVDGCVFLGACLSCIVIKKMKIRTLLFSTGVTANILLLTLSTCMYFHSEKGGYFAWVNCILLALYSVVVNLGLYPVFITIIGEIFPLELKAYFYCLSGIILGISIFLSIKLAGDLFSTLGYHGTFLLNVLLMSLCLVYLWFKLPETKGRSMQEIELYFKNNTFDEVNKVLNGEQVKVLI